MITVLVRWLCAPISIIQVVTFRLRVMVLVKEIYGEKIAGEWTSEAEKQGKQGTTEDRKTREGKRNRNAGPGVRFL